MFERRSLKWPIVLGIVMIVLVVTLTVGWVLLNIWSASADQKRAALYYTLLAVGSVVLAIVLGGTIAYLTLTVKAINLNRRQSNFIDSVTHELKSPIASLKLYLQTLSRRPVSDQQRSDFHRYMLDDLERLDSLINHLLDAARLERQISPHYEQGDLKSIIEEMAATIELRYRLPAGAIEVEMPSTSIEAPLVDVGIVFRNLIDNAVKYGGKPPHVAVRGEEPCKGRVVVSIADNGGGVPPALRRKIFGRFVRVGSELERSQPGTGLGLYLVRTLVRRLKGSVRIVERRDSTGTIFEVTLPVNPPERNGKS